ncbi:MAG: formylglycine-generating enzyme family protein [Planctomycetes bacterium]|nr:formylglycine-generating enzyme family protein [Planctomycetota bacterium]
MNKYRLHRQFLWTLVAAIAIPGIIPQAQAADPAPFRFEPGKNMIPAPRDPAVWPAFRTQLKEWRDTTRHQLKYSDALYRRSDFAWSTRNFSCCFLMLCDETFYDPRQGMYTPDAFLDHGQREFGGYDSVILWQAYPRIGVDERNQFDFYRDAPGGLPGLRKAVEAMQRRGVRVYVAYNPWDTGTRREAVSDADALVEMVRSLQVDGIFLDTLTRGGEDLRAKLDAVRPGVILEGELALPLDRVHDHHASWAQWFGDSETPGVLHHKWLEPRHMQHQVDRWLYDHTRELQAAWMNGSGIMVWENVFASWIPWSQRDRSILRAMLPIQRRYAAIFASEGWTPLVPTRAPGVYASLWEGSGLRLWTVVNRNKKPVDGALLDVPTREADRYFDLVAGQEAKQQAADKTIILSGRLEPRGIGAFLAGSAPARGNDFSKFLAAQARINSDANFDTATPKRETTLVAVQPTAGAAKVPSGMVAISGGTVELKIEMRARECGFYESMPGPNHKLGGGNNTEIFPRRVVFKPYAIDETPVTNAQFAEFIKASGYAPKQPDKFLHHWRDGRPPAGKGDHPVVYVDLDDARAYARWAGKRLPTEEEWQYAAQGTDGRRYPWGNAMQPDCANDGKTSGTTPVKAFPKGRSPFGCYDMCGNVWQWTESERTDGRTRFCMIRGGSYFTARGSNWYVDGGLRPAGFTTKFLLCSPSLDRCGTVGFRCVVDLDDSLSRQ